MDESKDENQTIRIDAVLFDMIILCFFLLLKEKVIKMMIYMKRIIDEINYGGGYVWFY